MRVGYRVRKRRLTHREEASGRYAAASNRTHTWTVIGGRSSTECAVEIAYRDTTRRATVILSVECDGPGRRYHRRRVVDNRHRLRVFREITDAVCRPVRNGCRTHRESITGRN